MALVQQTVEIKGINEVRSMLDAIRQENPEALRRAVNKGVDRSRTLSWQEVKAKFTINRASFYARFRQWKAAVGQNPSGKVRVEPSPGVSLHEFKTSMTQRGVKVTIRKDRGARLIAGAFHLYGSRAAPVFQRKHMPTGLVWNTMDPKRAVRIPWKRIVQQGKLPKEARLPITKLYSLTAAQMLDDGNSLDNMMESVSEDMLREFERQMDRMLAK